MAFRISTPGVPSSPSGAWIVFPLTCKPCPESQRGQIVLLNLTSNDPLVSSLRHESFIRWAPAGTHPERGLAHQFQMWDRTMFFMGQTYPLTSTLGQSEAATPHIQTHTHPLLLPTRAIDLMRTSPTEPCSVSQGELWNTSRVNRKFASRKRTRYGVFSRPRT